MGQRRTDQSERRLDVDRPEVVKVGLVTTLEIHHPQNAGIIDERINAPEAVRRRFDPGSGRLGEGGVEAVEVEPVAGREPVGQARRVPQAEGEGPSLFRQPPCDGAAEAPPPTRDQRHALHQNSP
jgi:hypothetical protein